MRIVTGADTGLVKLISYENQTVIGSWGRQEASECVDQMFRCDDVHKMETVYVVRKSNVIEHWNIENGSVVQQIRLPDIASKQPHRYTGLYRFSTDNVGAVMTSTNFGDVYILPFDTLHDHDQKPDPLISFNVGCDNEAVRVNFNKETELAAGGEKTLLRVYDINTQKKIWNAKNLPNNEVRLSPPVWIRDLQYLPAQAQSIVTVTSYSQIRLYDTRAQRRCLFNEVVGEKALTCVAVTPDSNYAIMGNTMGGVFIFDLRQRKILGKCKGKNVGSIREISCHPSEPLFACASLDRYCRVFDYNTRELKLKMYMKQRLTSCTFFKEPPIDEDEETWEQLPETEGDPSSDSESEPSDLEELAEAKVSLTKRKRSSHSKSHPAKKKKNK